jgi:uncharacterized protein with FMN-binding domain
MTPSGSNKKVANSLVAVSFSAVLAVYAAGYVRTRSAAERFEVQAAERRAAIPNSIETAPPLAEYAPITPAAPEAPRAPSVAPNPARETDEHPGLIAPAEPAPAASVPEITAALPPAETPAPPSFEVAPVAAPVVLAPPTIRVMPALEPKAEIAPSAPPTPKWKDGTYFGWGTSRHGDIQAEVVIEGGRIQSATIAQCRTRYSCSVIDKLPPQVAQRQSPEVDFVSRATQSTNAFYYAVVEALSKAK